MTSEPDRSNLVRQFVRFVGVGGIATALMYLLLGIQVELLHWAATLSSTLAYILSSIFNYWANYHFTFASSASHQKALPRFVAIAGCGLGLNGLIMYSCTSMLDWHYFAAQLLATLAVLLWNFYANRRWTYASNAPSARVTRESET